VGVAVRVAVSVATVAGMFLSSCSPCRSIEARPFSLECDTAAALPGELHFDSASSFRNYLLSDCTPNASDAELAAVTDRVDFSRDVVFIAVGSRQLGGRCVAARVVDEAAVCEDGLRMGFRDTEGDCGGNWVAGALIGRDDMRQALDLSPKNPTPAVP
jgi:hypothetical protein